MKIRIKTLMSLIVLLTLGAWLPIALALDINSATAEQIASGLKGVGLKKAQAIVAFRDKQGSFKSLDDLLKVKGIGKKLLEINADNISLEKPQH